MNRNQSVGSFIFLTMITDLLAHFTLDSAVTACGTFGNGLINHTWLVETKQKKYILQRINDQVFTNPAAIDDNINAIAGFLKIHFQDYIFTAPVFSKDHKSLIQLNDRETDFLKYACTEMTYKEIADKMFVSPRTIDGYRDALFEKLHVKTRVGLVMYAIKNGVVNI